MKTLYSWRASSPLALAVIFTLVLAARPAMAAFELLDDFESYPPGNVQDDPSSPWTAHGTTLFTILEEAGNRFLGFAWSDAQRAGSRSLPAHLQIGPGDEATLFLQFRAGGLSGSQNAHFGLAHNVNAGSHAPTDDFRVETRLVPGPAPGEHTLEVRDGDEYRAVATVVQGSWYNLWYAIDRTAGDTFRLYMNVGDNDASGADLLGYEQNGATVTEFSFRDTGAPTDTIDGFLAHGHASPSRSVHLDNLWIDTTGENLAFVGEDLDAWQFAYESLAAPFDLTFGMDTGDESGESLLRNRPQDFVLQWDVLRLVSTAETFTSTAAFATVENYVPRLDFTLEAEMTLRSLGQPSTQRAGLAVLGGPHTPIDAPFNATADQSFYGLVWFPAVDGETSIMQIREGFNGPVLAEGVWEGRHPSIANGGQVGQVLQLRADGVFNASGLLELTFTLTDQDNFTESLSALIVDPLEGNLFGIGGRVAIEPDGADPEFDFHALSMTVGDEPVEITDPAVSWPFSFAFGSGEGRDSGESFSKNRPDDWSLEPEALRLTTEETGYHASSSTAWVFNYEAGDAFGLRARATLENLRDDLAYAPPDGPDNRLALVLFGDADREVFDPDDDDSYFTFQWRPDPGGPGSVLAVRRGMNGDIIAVTNLNDLDDPPQAEAGGTYDVEFNALFKQDGSMVFIATLTDEAGRTAEVLGEIEEAPAGNRFGFGAWHRAAEEPVWDFHEFAMGDPSPGLGAVAAYTDNDRVTGFAVQEPALGYRHGINAGLVGSEGDAGTRRHHNPVLGFVLPDVPAEKIVRFDLTVSRAAGRDDRSADLYGLLPADPSTYNDGTITPGPDGIDVWWQGPEIDDRLGLIGGSWPQFIPQGAPADASFTQDVTDFILSLYDEDGPTQEKVYFRLSPTPAVGLTGLARTTVTVARDLPNSPTLSYLVFPPVAPDPFITSMFNFAFGTGPERDNLEDFARNVPGDWMLTGDSARLAPASAELHNSLNTSRVLDFEDGTSFGLRTRMTLSALGGEPGDSRVGLVFLGSRDREDFDADDPDSYFTFQWTPNAATGASIAVRRGMDGPVIAETDLSGLGDAPATTAGTTYALEFHGVYNQAGGLDFVGILRDEAGREATTSGTIEGPLGDRYRFGFGARHSAAQGPVWDFHDFTMIEGWKIAYQELEAPFAFEFGTAPGRDSGAELLIDEVHDWILQDEALRLDPTQVGSFASSAASAVVSNYVTGQDFTVETEFTLRSLVPPANLNRLGLVVLGDTHSPFDDPFQVENDAGFYTLAWFLGTSATDDSTSLRIRDGFNGTQIGRLNPDPDVPKVIDGLYHLKAEGIFLEGGDLELTFTLTHEGTAYVASGVVNDPYTGNMFGIGARTRQNEDPVFDIHSFSVTLGEPPDPPVGITFADWGNEYFTQAELDDPNISGPGAMPAGDGIANVVKYSADRDPKAPLVSSALFAAGVIDGELRLSYFERTDTLDLEYIAEISEDLVNWESGPSHVEEIARSAVADNLDDVTVRALLPPGAPKGFIRVTLRLVEP